MLKMLKIRCPKCGTFVYMFDRSFKVYSNFKRKCTACEEDFELSNSVVVGVIYGLLLAGIFKLLLYGNIHLLLRFAVIFLTIIFVPIVTLRLFGRWHICEGEKKWLKKLAGRS